MEVRELAVPDTAAASARAFAALKLFRLFSRCCNGSVGIPWALFSADLASRDFPADTDRLGEPFGDFLPPEPADAARAFEFSAMVATQSIRSNPRADLHGNVHNCLELDSSWPATVKPDRTTRLITKSQST